MLHTNSSSAQRIWPSGDVARSQDARRARLEIFIEKDTAIELEPRQLRQLDHLPDTFGVVLPSDRCLLFAHSVILDCSLAARIDPRLLIRLVVLQFRHQNWPK